MKTRPQLASAALCLLLSGCGRSGGTPAGGGDAAPDAPDGDAAACPGAPPCGGNLLGTWSVATTCLDVDLSEYTRDCPSSSARARDYQITGTVTYTADLTYQLMNTLTGTVVVDLPADCLTPPNGVQVTCAQLEPALLATGKFQSVACLLRNGGGCVCSIDPLAQTWYGAGTFRSTPSGALTQTDPSQGADMIDYCVTDEGTLTLSPPPGKATLARHGVIAGSLTLTKK